MQGAGDIRRRYRNDKMSFFLLLPIVKLGFEEFVFLPPLVSVSFDLLRLVRIGSSRFLDLLFLFLRWGCTRGGLLLFGFLF